MLVIQVEIRNVYGEDRIYPICDKAKRFATMLGQQTLTQKDISHIKALGYTVEVIQQKKVL